MPDNEHLMIGRLRKLELPERSFIVMGSGILEALHIRRAADIDMVVTTELFGELRTQGWEERVASNGAIGLEYGMFQAYDSWKDDVKEKTAEELLVDAQWIEGIPYNSLKKLRLYKERRDMPKDRIDIALIDAYLSSR